MQWLIANMWMALAAATLLGLLFGMSFRGLLASSSIRRARVERDIAQTELKQSKDEIDALFADQRKRKEESAQAVSGDTQLRAELDERETRITALGDELAAAQNELEQLKAAKDTDPVTAIAPVPIPDASSEELTQLRDRNAWLEERVGTLEADLSAAPQAAAAVPVEAAESESPDLAKEKLLWQTAYLRQRVDALENKVIEAETVRAPELAEEAVSVPIATLVPASEPEQEPDTPERSEADEELARLRWRNRYLEGRLAYFEQAPEEADEETAAAVEEIAEAEASAETEQEAEPETDAEAENDADGSEAVAAEPDTEVHPSEAMLAELEGVQPTQIEEPSGGGDDLTQITGIGPRIAEVLNGLGIWTYAQVAEWQPEHETWIENHLAFKGRVGRENWVGQAKDLLVAA